MTNRRVVNGRVVNEHCLGRRLRAGLTAAALAGAVVLVASATATAAPAVTSTAAAARPLSGKVIGVDPGHNGGNFTHAAEIDKKIWNGREWEACNTTGTATNGGYTEALFNFGSRPTCGLT